MLKYIVVWKSLRHALRCLHARRILLISASALLTNGAYATLGKPLESMQSDAIKMKATLRVKASAASAGSAFAVHELTASNGTIVRQYVSADGFVFGVAWSGPYMPNLRQLLGDSFATLSEHEAKGGYMGPAAAQIDEVNLVIQSHGHMRDFTGRAFLPLSVPLGVNPDVIQ